MRDSCRGLSAALLVVCLGFSSLAGCGAASMKMASAAMAQAPAPMPAAPLTQSLFEKDPHGQLSEEALQTILASPIELDLPSRVGVLPVSAATDWRGPGPQERVPAGVSGFVRKLRNDPAFTLVTETMVIPSGALGMEALREIAARYRLRYLLLYREVVAKESSLNPWAWGYATVVGALFLPGQRQEVYGYIEASMFDVKTGLLMFTTRRSISASQHSNQWRQHAKLDQLAANVTSRFAPDLATDVLADLHRFASAAIAENARRGVMAPMVAMPGTTGAAIASEPLGPDHIAH